MKRLLQQTQFSFDGLLHTTSDPHKSRNGNEKTDRATKRRRRETGTILSLAGQMIPVATEHARLPLVLRGKQKHKVTVDGPRCG